jgi:hypothetical protein
MRRTGIAGLVLVGVLLGALALISHASAPSLAGVAVLQFSCTPDPNYGPVYGPTTVPLDGAGFCDPNGFDTPGPMPVPGGTLYHLRVLPGAGTADGSIPKVTYTLYDGIVPTPLTCTTGTLPFNCDDFTHEYQVKSGDQIWINATIPDSNTFVNSGTATVEETVFR